MRAWEETSGLRAEPQALRWWQVFASLKGMGIWLSSSEDFHAGASKSAGAGHGRLALHRPPAADHWSDYLSPYASHRFGVDAS